MYWIQLGWLLYLLCIVVVFVFCALAGTAQCNSWACGARLQLFVKFTYNCNFFIAYCFQFLRSHQNYILSKKRIGLIVEFFLQVRVVSCCVGVLLLVHCCVVVTIQGLGRSMMGPLLGGKQPFRRSRDGLVFGCEEGDKWNWVGSCGGGTGCRRTFCVVGHDLDDENPTLGWETLSK